MEVDNNHGLTHSNGHRQGKLAIQEVVDLEIQGKRQDSKLKTKTTLCLINDTKSAIH